MKTLSENKCFGGTQGVYAHRSASCNCNMTFGLFLPAEAAATKVPLLWYLSGLTCTHENAMIKAGAQQFSPEHITVRFVVGIGVGKCFKQIHQHVENTFFHSVNLLLVRE